MKLQKSWIMWAILVLVIITLFGPSMVVYAADAHTPTNAYIDLVLGAFGDCGRVMTGQVH